MSPETTEICVIGGGSAGAAAAYRLARLGHDVMLIERNVRRRPRMIESLPPSILRLLEFLDLAGYVEGCRGSGREERQSAGTMLHPNSVRAARTTPSLSIEIGSTRPY